MAYICIFGYHLRYKLIEKVFVAKHICQSVWNFKSVITDITQLCNCLGPLFLERKWIVKYLEMPIGGLRCLKKNTSDISLENSLEGGLQKNLFSLKWKRKFLTSDCFAWRVTLLNSKDPIYKRICRELIFIPVFTDVDRAVGGWLLATAFLQQRGKLFYFCISLFVSSLTSQKRSHSY